MTESTEEKIKNAARTVFHKKGYAAARTRDIAAEAGINLALLNYYFRSKEKLFEIIMQETFQSFFVSMSGVFNDPESTFEEKMETISNRYIDMLSQNPEIVIFIFNELRSNPDKFLKKYHIKEVLTQSILFKQFAEFAGSAIHNEKHAMHIFANLMGMIIFPFIASPFLKEIFGLNNDEFNDLMNERRHLIPQWTKTMIYPV